MPVPSSYKEAYDAVKSEADKTSDYKCIVTVFAYGGMDTHCVLVPTDVNPNRSFYDQNRSGDSLSQAPYRTGVNTDESPINSLDANWRLHPNLTMLKSLWDDGDLAFVKDMGVLNKTTTKAELTGENNDDFKVSKAFSHQHQQQQMQESLDFKDIEVNGVFGRTAALFDPYYLDDESSTYPPIYNPNQDVPTCSYTVTGVNYQTVSYSPVPINSYPPSLIEELDRYSLSRADVDQAADQMAHMADSDNPDLSTNKINSSFVEVFKKNSEGQEKLTNDVIELSDDLEAIFDSFFAQAGSKGDSFPYYISTFKNVARIIYSRNELKQRRQMIFVGVGSWDHHAKLRQNIDQYLISLNDGLDALIQFLKHPSVDLFDNVVIHHASDFSRTLRSNGNSGTDHAWSQHAYVIGGSVNGGMYPTGYECDYTIEGPKSDGNRSGRYIPEVSSDQFYAKILNWFGVPGAQLGLVLPGLKYFVNGSNLNFTFATGNYTINFI